MRARLLAAALALALLACPAPPPPGRGTAPAAAPGAEAPRVEPSAAEPAAAPLADAPDDLSSTSDAGPPPHPAGVAFPLPDPWPVEACPRAVTPPRPPQPGQGALLSWVGPSGHEPGQFEYPRALTCAEDGTLFVVDKAGRIQRLDREGRVERLVRTPEIAQGKPTGLRLARDGTLLVADTHYCRVLVYDRDLNLLRTWGVPGPDPGQFMLLSCVFQGADGRIYTTDYGDYVARVQVWSAEGRLQTSFGSYGGGDDQLRRPMALWVDDARDEVYVADASNHRVVVTDRQGKLRRILGGLGTAPGRLQYPYDVVLDGQDRLWVAEFGNHRVSVLDREGRCLGLWGEPGRQLGSLARPWGATPAPGDRLWLLDSGNDRLYLLPASAVLGRDPEEAR